MNPNDHARLRQFQCLNHQQQKAAIRHLAAAGLGDYTIAAATRWSVEAVRQVLSKQKELL